MEPAQDDDVIVIKPYRAVTIRPPVAVQMDAETYHRVANSLQPLFAMILLHAREINDDHVRHVVFKTQQRIAAIVWVHCNLY